MTRKYRQAGYQDSDRDRDRRPDSRPRTPPPARSTLTPEERAQQRGLKHAVDRSAKEVVRCPQCGRNVEAFGVIGTETSCPHCRASLRCCKACRHFDPGARWECRATIVERVADKGAANACTGYEPRLVLDATGKRSAEASRGGDDPRSLFNNLFKR